jgi:hypothetical protein
MANVLEEAKAARDAVRSRNLVVQIGTQHRSEPYQIAAKESIASGALGDVSKVEIVWNYHGPRWRGRQEVNQIREQDTDWKKWLLTKPYARSIPAFTRVGHREFSSGIPDQWMSYGVDSFTPPKTTFRNPPRSAVSSWPDGREIPILSRRSLE